MLSDVPGLCSADARSIPPVCQPQLSPDIVVPGGEIMPGCEPWGQKHSERIVEAERIESFYLGTSEKGCWGRVLEVIPAANVLNSCRVLSVWLCMEINRSFLNGGKRTSGEQHHVFGEP